MNERVKELEKQCYEHNQSWNSSGERIFNKEKFAELIIMEAVSILDEQEEYFSSALIMKHFGVLDEQ